jgi:Flp pilus assembly CpaE family ATPase
MKTIIVQLTEEDVASLRNAASDRLNHLYEAEMDDPALERLIHRITQLAEKAWKVKYGQQL